MTFGNFAENYEFAAMKSSGISLQRAMRSVIVFVLLTAVGAFYLADSLIPAAEVKTWNMRRNLTLMKPAMAISEGVFNSIGEFNIKVAKKYGDNDNFLKDVIIHQKSKSKKNLIVTKATEGKLQNDQESGILQLILKDGYRYEEIIPKNNIEKQQDPHTKASFKRYAINIDLTSENSIDFESELGTKTYKMKDVVSLNKDIDSLEKQHKNRVTLFGKDLYRRNDIIPQNTSEKKLQKAKVQKQEYKLDSSYNSLTKIIAAKPLQKQQQILDQVDSKVKQQISLIERKAKTFNRNTKYINAHKIQFHKKIALGFACIILFFIGAPLGAIIKKGGLGLPIVIAIIIFLTYYFIGIFGENNAKDGGISPALGAWISTLIMLPFSILVIRQAATDRRLFISEKITSPVRSLLEYITRVFKKI